MTPILRLVAVLVIAAGLAAADFEKNRYGTVPASVQDMLKNAVDVQSVLVSGNSITISLAGVDMNDHFTSAPALAFANAQSLTVRVNDEKYVIVWAGSDRFVYHELPKKK